MVDGSRPGQVVIPPGSSSAFITFRVPAGTSAGSHSFTIDIDHEANDESNKNYWINTNITRGELTLHPNATQKLWWPGQTQESPYIPCTKAYGPNGALNGDGSPWLSFTTGAKLNTQQDPAAGLAIQSVGQFNNANYGAQYYRDGFNDQFFCDGPEAVSDVQNWNVWSFYWAKPPSPYRSPRYVALTYRRRTGPTGESNFTVIFDRDAQSSNKNYDGTTYGTLGGTVTTDEGVWNIYRVLDSGVGDLTGNFTYGIIEESINDPATNQAANHTRLWLKYERNTSDPDDTGYKPVMLTWPVYDTSTNIKASDGRLTVSQAADDNYACLAYGHTKEMVSSDPGNPSRHWPRPRGEWEPRGYAVKGTIVSRTVNLTVT
jgi:hypothetical protein